MLFDRSLHRRTPLACSFLLLLTAACDCGGKKPVVGDPCTGNTECGDVLLCVDNVCVDPADTGVTDAAMDAADNTDAADAADANADAVVIDTSITGITISAPPATLDVTIGTPNSSLVFTVTAQLVSGGTMVLPVVTYESTNVAAGVINGNGTYAASGAVGGPVTVTATVVAPNGTFTDDVTFNVRLTSTSGAGTGPGSPGVVFGGTPVTDSAADAEILYPLHGAVMPQNVQPADIQWACSSAGATCPEADFFRVTVQKPNLLVTRYVRNDMSAVNDHLVHEVNVWRAITQTDPASDAVIRVDRYQSAMTRVITGVAVNVRFAQVAITGTVYYWDIDDRTIRSIEDGATMSTIALPNINSPIPDPMPPATRPADDSCVGCHSVSPSGRYMLANMHSDNFGGLFDLTRSDLRTAVPTPSEFMPTTSLRWRLSSWSPDERRAMVSTATESPDRLRLLDPTTGQIINDTFNAAGSPMTLPNNGTMPAWARDDSRIAFITDANSWAGNTTTGNLSILPVANSALDRFGTPFSLLLASALTTPSNTEVQGFSGNHGIFYPTFTPDSQWLAFAHGTSSRSDPRDAGTGWTALDYAHTSALYLMRPDGTGRVRLTRGCAATTPELRPGASASTERRGLDFQPNFAPFQGGGYFWLSFLSRRPYGNTISGNLNTTPNAIRPGQIWVMAIRMNADGSMDPSEVAYWLPGQTPTHRAVSAYWAPRPCRGNGEGCGVGSECCSGDCRAPAENEPLVCSPPLPQMCRQIGQTCSSVADCCGYPADTSLVCTGNVCEQVVIID